MGWAAGAGGISRKGLTSRARSGCRHTAPPARGQSRHARGSAEGDWADFGPAREGVKRRLPPIPGGSGTGQERGLGKDDPSREIIYSKAAFRASEKCPRSVLKNLLNNKNVTPGLGKI